MDKDFELEFRGKINEITKSDKSLIIMFDGKSGTLKSKMLDKVIDKIEPSRYELCKYKREDFITKRFWEKGVTKHKIMIWDGSYKQDLKTFDKEALKEIDFFEQQMERYGFSIVSLKFKNDKDTYLKYDKEKNTTKIYGENEDEVFNLVIAKIILEIDKALKRDMYKPEIPAKIANPINFDDYKNKYEYNEQDWKKLQEKYQDKIKKYHEKMIKKKKSLLIVLQGVDAAGKSSTIKRMISKMCPHWYNVYGIGTPTQEELNHHYLWRFWTKLPKNGEIVILDRSYYERLTAERVYRLNNDGWVNGVAEIKEFERELEKNGIHIVRFFFNIDKKTQGERFKERETNPLKTWKISDADYKTREKWNEFQKAFTEMLGAFPEMHIIDAKNKREARVNALKILAKEMKKMLK